MKVYDRKIDGEKLRLVSVKDIADEMKWMEGDSRKEEITNFQYRGMWNELKEGLQEIEEMGKSIVQNDMEVKTR